MANNSAPPPLSQHDIHQARMKAFDHEERSIFSDFSEQTDDLREALTCHAIHIGNEDEKEEARSEDNEREDRERKEMLTLRPAIYDLPPCGCWRWPRPAVQTIPKGPENKGPGGVAEDTGDATPRPGSPVKAQKKAHIVRCRRGGITPPIDENDDLFGPSIGDSRSEKKARSGAKEEQTATGTSGRAPSPSRAVPLQSPQPLKFINSAMSPSLVPTGARLPHSVVNSPSVTPPPNISTRINQPSSRSETLGPRNESATSTTTDGTEFKGPNESTSIISTCSTEKASGLQTQPATNPRQRSINTSPAEANLPQFGTDNLDPPSDFASVAPSISSEFSGKQTMATSQSGPASADDTSTTASAAGTTATIGTSSSSTAAITATPSTSTGAWSQRNPISSKDAILRALDPGNLPEPKEDEALFLPADADRIWYMGFLREWSKFKEEAIEFWGTRQCHDAFEELKIYPLTPRRASDSDITDESHGSERLHSHFQRGALEVTRKVYNALMETETMEGDHEVFLGDAEDEDLANNDVKWEPSYVVKARDGEDEATRALGQVEYLGGRKDALTWAISKATMNSWGSLRCVLGEIAQYMLRSSTKFAFLASADEVMCLKFDLIEKVDYDTNDDEDPIDLFVEPNLWYSKPIKFADVLDENRGTVSVKLALLYLLHCGMQKDYEMKERLGNSMKYFKKTKAGRACLPKLSFKPGTYLNKRF